MKERNRHNDKILIEESTRTRRLPGLARMGAMGTVGMGTTSTTKMGVVGIVAVALNLGMSMIA